MKIALFDPYLPKFTKDMTDWWTARGHEVQTNRYYNPALAEWADVIWFDTCDNNLTSATNPGSAILDDEANYKPWDLHDMDLSNKKVICRPIDIEVWQGHWSASKWDVVDDIIFIAPHIRDIIDPNALPEYKGAKIHTINCAVNLDRYKFAERGPGFDIAVVGERWMSKGADYILQIALKLKQIDSRYKIHWLGKRSDYQWELAYFDDFIEHHELPIEITNWIEGDDGVDNFLEGKNYLLSASHKEAFGYNIAEAMAKGIKPVVHRFYGADDLWPGMVWSGIDEAIEMITETDNYHSGEYRQYLIDLGYDLPSMMEKFDAIINNKE
jgi:hypothetical protein